MNKYVEVLSKEELKELLTKNPTIKHIRIMFEDCSYLYVNTLVHIDPYFETIDLTCWDVSRVTNMDHMFYNAGTFNQDISNWNVSNVVCMHGMFGFACIFNQDLSKWDTSSVIDMRCMFSNAKLFNKDISTWDISSVQYTRYMFEDCGLKIVPRQYKLLEEYYSG